MKVVCQAGVGSHSPGLLKATAIELSMATYQRIVIYSIKQNAKMHSQLKKLANSLQSSRKAMLKKFACVLQKSRKAMKTLIMARIDGDMRRNMKYMGKLSLRLLWSL